MDILRLGRIILHTDETFIYDPRTIKWKTMSTPYPAFGIIFLYLYIVLKGGPSFMKNRKPYDLKTFIKGYNIFQIIANGTIMYYMVKYGLFTEIPLTCIPPDLSPVGNSMKMAELFWYVWLLKTVDFTETIIFVLRKKNKQISFLHLYHHVSTMLFTSVVVKVLPGGVVTVHLFTNSLVHVIMYSYYFLSSCGPTIQRKISPFKRYVTIIQMVQFGLLTLHILQGYDEKCAYETYKVNLVLWNLIINFVLFFNFYRQTYWKSQTKVE